MPCKYVVLNQGHVVVERWIGALGFDALIAHKEQQRRDPAIRSPASVLSDCRLATVEISPDAIDELSALEGDHQGQGVQRYAFLVKPEVYERVGRFRDGVRPLGKSVFIFNRLETACAWLELNPAEVEAAIARLHAGGD